MEVYLRESTISAFAAAARSRGTAHIRAGETWMSFSTSSGPTARRSSRWVLSSTRKATGWISAILANPKDDVPLRIDLPRTWTFVRALIEDPEAALQSIYVAEHLRRLLLDHARNDGAPEATWKRFAQMTCQPSYPHDDHFHFRFYCSAEDIALGCRDSHPLHAWRRAELAALGVTSKPLLPKRPMAATVTVSHEEARRAAGTLAPEVEDWLLRRKVWLEKPHPGRPYCP